MSLIFTVFAKNSQREKEWTHAISTALASIVDVRVETGSGSTQIGNIVLVDAEIEHISKILGEIDRQNKAIYLVIDQNNNQVPQLLEDGHVDEIILFPFRALDLVSKIRYYEQIILWKEISEVNSSFTELLDQIKDDLLLAERLQKSKLPRRFSDVKGFRVLSRYLAGMRSGGDYFDIAESKDSASFSVILSNSSSYGLSSSLLSVIMKVMLKMSADQLHKSGSILSVVKQIQDELLLTLGEKDQLSLFFGVISRNDNRLRFLNLGSSFIFLSEGHGAFQSLRSQAGTVSKKSSITIEKEESISLPPESRLVLISGGLVEALQGEEKLCQLLNSFRAKDAAELLNELIFQVKSQLGEEDVMPNRDCTAIVLDADSRVFKLTKRELDEN